MITCFCFCAHIYYQEEEEVEGIQVLTSRWQIETTSKYLSTNNKLQGVVLESSFGYPQVWRQGYPVFLDLHPVASDRMYLPGHQIRIKLHQTGEPIMLQ